MKDSFQLNEMELFGLNSFGGNIGIAGVQILALIVGALSVERKGRKKTVSTEKKGSKNGWMNTRIMSVKFLCLSESLSLLSERVSERAGDSLSLSLVRTELTEPLQVIAKKQTLANTLNTKVLPQISWKCA